MKAMLAAASMALLLAANPAGAETKQPSKTDAAPAMTFSVPAPCADVWHKVYTDLDPSWKVTVLAPSAEDEKLPDPDVQSHFFSRVPGLERALAKLDAVDRDAFFVRVQTRPLAELQKKYPKVKRELLEAAKVERCKAAAAR